MNETILVGRGSQIFEIPDTNWKNGLALFAENIQPRLNFMSEAHHQVRNLVVRELLHLQKPLAPELISEKSGLAIQKVASILDELEQKLFFLVRNEQGQVEWAYPVTVAVTPHKLIFSSGERLYGA